MFPCCCTMATLPGSLFLCEPLRFAASARYQADGLLILGEVEHVSQTDRFVIRFNLDGELGESMAKLEDLLANALLRKP